MDDGSSNYPRMTAGLDLADKYSHLCLIDTDSGGAIEEGRLRTTPEALRGLKEALRFGAASYAHSHRGWNPLALGRPALGGVWPRGLGGQCPQTEAHLRQSKHKTDEVDAENLARLARLDPKLLYPLKHRGEEAQAHMALIRSRQALVDCRTQLVNHVRGAVKSFGHRLPKCPARSFHTRASESTSPRRSGLPWSQSSSRSLRSPSASEDTTAGWKPSAKRTTQKRISCTRSRGSGRSRRSRSCSPWRNPTASKRAAV